LCIILETVLNAGASASNAVVRYSTLAAVCVVLTVFETQVAVLITLSDVLPSCQNLAIVFAAFHQRTALNTHCAHFNTLFTTIHHTPAVNTQTTIVISISAAIDHTILHVSSFHDPSNQSISAYNFKRFSSADNHVFSASVLSISSYFIINHLINHTSRTHVNCIRSIL